MSAQDQDDFFGYRLYPLTATMHKSVYPNISPDRAELSQTGKTVLITGGTAGIGYEIAKTFGLAGAKRVLITGRDQAKTEAAAAQLSNECKASGVCFDGMICKIPDTESINALWVDLGCEGIHVDVLILNAAMTSGAGKMWDIGWSDVWRSFEVNYIVNVATSNIHDWQAGKNQPTYALTKNSATVLLQQLARETLPSDLQIVSFHPGAILTTAARAHGADDNMLDWDNVNLPASVAIWAASPEAAFLHGRFIWAGLDIPELQSGSLRDRIEKDIEFLRIGVHGLTNEILASQKP